MKLNSTNMHSPCVQCYIHGHTYSPDDESCQGCEYNIAIQVLKVILKCDDGCSLCKNRNNLGGGYWDCKLTGTDNCDCCIEKDFAIDWPKVLKEYDIKEG